MNESIHFDSTTRLSPADHIADFHLHCAAVEWSLIDPIILNSADEIQSRPQWDTRIQPFLHQQRNLFTFCRRLPGTLLADDVGLGKTISAGLIISELMTRRRVSRTLVLCPNLIAPQWKDELASKFGIESVITKGSQLIRMSQHSIPVVITTYETARAYIEQINSDSFDFLILDEAHKLRNLWGAVHSPETGRRIRRVLESRLFKYVLMMTATPMHNRLFDLYSLIDLLTVAKGHANPLGSPKNFEKVYVDRNAKRVKPESAEKLHAVLRDYIVRTRRSDANLKFPTRQVRTLRVQPSRDEETLIEASKTLLQSLTMLSRISLAQALISSPRALISQLENMEANGTISHSVRSHLCQLASRIDCPSKLRKLHELIRELCNQRPRDWRLVIFTTRRPTQDMICELLREMGVTHGVIQGAAPQQNQKTVEQFRKSPPAIHVVVTTDAGAEGVNLQSGNVLVNYDLPWNPMTVEQRIGRLQRLASIHETVEVLNLAVAGSVEDRIVVRLIEKLQGIASAIGDIESIIEAGNWQNQDDETLLAQTIAELVVNSLLSHDVSAATAMAERSIEQARDFVETRRQELDQLFGTSDDGAEDQLFMPPLYRPKPSLGPREFVLQAKSHEGLKAVEAENETVYFHEQGRLTEIAAFSQSAFDNLRSQSSAHHAIRFYQPGKADFERLVQKWTAASSHHIYDCPPSPDSHLMALVNNWAASLPETEVVGFEIVGRTARFDGKVHVKVRLANGVDSYEKIIIQAHGISTLEYESAIPHQSTLRDVLRPADVVPNLFERLANEIEEDADLRSFKDFYENRMRLDLRRAGGDPGNHKKVESDFRTSSSATVSGIQGIHHEELTLRISYRVMGGGPYQSEVGLLPAITELTFEPRRGKCWQTSALVPVDCLGICAVSGHLVLKHLLTVSDKSGALALPQFLVTCDVSRASLLPNEAQRLHDGRAVDKSLVGQSAVSQRFALLSDLVYCDFTGKLALPEETLFSEVSGHRLTVDDQSVSSVSGTIGFRNEFVTCDATQLPILPWEADLSDYSHRTVRADLLMRSEKIPARKGLSVELQRCAVTGRRLLLDEGSRSGVSDLFVDRDLLFPSQVSGIVALLDELIVCEVTSQLLLPLETDRCSLTGKTVDQRLLSICAKTGCAAQTHLLERCEATDQLVVPKVLATCAVTGRRVLSHLLEQCAVTGQLALSTSLQVSAVSGRRMIPSVAVTSAVSQQLAAPDEVVHCDCTGKVALPNEVTECGLTGQHVLTELTSTCAATGVRALTSLLVICEETNQTVIPDLVTCCAATGKRIRKSLLEPCAVTHKLALPSAMVASSVSGRRMIPSVAVTSAVSQQLAAPDEVVHCDCTGKVALPNEVTECGLTGQHVLTELTSTCAATGVRALNTHLVVCAESQVSVVPELATRCAATGKQIRKSLLVLCTVTQRLALPSAMLASTVSQRLMLPKVAIRSGRSGLICHPDESVVCQWLQKRLLRSEAGICQLTGLIVDKTYLNPNRELKPLRKMLDGTLGETASEIELSLITQFVPDTVGKVQQARIIRSPGGAAIAISVETRRGFILSSIQYLGLVLLHDEKRRRVLGKIAVGKWSPSYGWIQESQILPIPRAKQDPEVSGH